MGLGDLGLDYFYYFFDAFPSVVKLDYTHRLRVMMNMFEHISVC